MEADLTENIDDDAFWMSGVLFAFVEPFSQAIPQTHRTHGLKQMLQFRFFRSGFGEWKVLDAFAD